MDHVLSRAERMSDDLDTQVSAVLSTPYGDVLIYEANTLTFGWNLMWE